MATVCNFDGSSNICAEHGGVSPDLHRCELKAKGDQLEREIKKLFSERAKRMERFRAAPDVPSDPFGIANSEQAETYRVKSGLRIAKLITKREAMRPDWEVYP